MHAPKEPITPIEKSRQLQRKLYLAAKKSSKRRFHALYDRITRPDVLWRAWQEVKASKGTAGIDGVTIERIEQDDSECFLNKLADELNRGIYRPKPVKRIYIPKPDGRTKRPLGIPTVKDRVVQQACRIVIEPLFEADFRDCSFGFRPKRSAHQALEEVRRNLIRNWWVVDADIQEFFDNLDHDVLITLLRRRISDRRVIKLIRCWLKSGILDGGTFIASDEGTPQGGVISPLLANIYLHVLDVYWTMYFPHLGKLCRYADDFLILCRHQRQAEEALRTVNGVLKKLKLSLHGTKTKLVNMNHKGFDFLGFHFHKCKSRNTGKITPLMWPSRKSMKSIRGKIKAFTGRRWDRMKLEWIVDRLNPLIRGYRNYFRVGNSTLKLQQLDRYVGSRLWRLYRKRRGKDNRFIRECFIHWINHNRPLRFFQIGCCGQSARMR